MLYLGELLLEHLLGFERDFDALRERTARRKRHLHRKVPFIECWDKLCPKSGEEQNRSCKHGKGNANGLPHIVHAHVQYFIIFIVEPSEEPVCKCRTWVDMSLQE